MTKKNIIIRKEGLQRCSLSSLHQLPGTKRSILSPPIKEVRNIKVLTKTALVADPATLLSPTSHHQQTDMARGTTSTRKLHYSSLLSLLGTPGDVIVSHTHTAAQFGSGCAPGLRQQYQRIQNTLSLCIEGRIGGFREDKNKRQFNPP